MSENQTHLELFGLKLGTLQEIVNAFEPARLRQARILAGKHKIEVARAIGVSAAAVGQYESGAHRPVREHVLTLAKTLQVEPGFFTAGRALHRVDTGSVHFRSLRSVRARDRDRALVTTEQALELAQALERHVRFPEVNLPYVKEGTLPHEAARLLRAHWGIGDGPFPHLVATMEMHGIIVLVLKEGSIEKVDAFSTQVSGRPLVISTPRRSNDVYIHRFTCAHELGHLLMHPEATPGDPIHEREADEFAAALLTPQHAMQAILPHRLDLAELSGLSRQWGVPVESLIRRMAEIRRSSDTSIRRAYQRLNGNSHLKTNEPWTSYPGESPSLLKQAIELCEQSRTTLADLAHELKWKPSRIRELAGIQDQRPKLALVSDPDL